MSLFTNQKFGGVFALANALTGFLILLVVFGLIGIAISANSEEVAEMALTNPFPLVLQDILKVFSAITALILLSVLYRRLKNENLAIIKAGTAFGVISVICLLINAGISMFLVLSASNTSLTTLNNISALRTVVLLMGMTTIFLNGFWYLAINMTALKNKRFPALFCYLGISIGLISLIPPFGLVVLVLGIIWSAWLGVLLMKENSN